MDRQSIITACLSVFPYSMNFCFYLAINFLPSLIYISPGTVCSTFIPLMLYMQDFFSLLGTVIFSIPVAVSAPPFSSTSLSILRPVGIAVKLKLVQELPNS